MVIYFMRKIKIFVFLLILLNFMLVFQGCQTYRYKTTEIADYGVFRGCYDNETVKELVTAFFPEKIEDYFKNVQYSFIGMTPDQYAFEAYLEFQIPDQVKFLEYVEKIAPPEAFTTFPFDPDFSEYTISDSLDLGRCIVDDVQNSSSSLPELLPYTIDYARIQKILVSTDDNRIIYVAIGLTDGGGASTSDLSTFFSRFDIAPKDYEAYCQSRNQSVET